MKGDKPALGGQTYGGQSMTGRLERVMVCAPAAAGWFDEEAWGQWQDLGYEHSPDSEAAQQQFAALCAALVEAGAEIVNLIQPQDTASAPAAPGADFPPNPAPWGYGGPQISLPKPDAAIAGAETTERPISLTLDAVYVHDASLLTEHGAILLRMGKEERDAEPALHRAFYESQGIPILGAIAEPGTVEGGDCVWLDPQTLLVGRGFRSNAAGIEQLRGMLGPHGVEVIAAPLPYSHGPHHCLHLMSIMSMLDEHTVLIEHARMAVETHELLEGRGLALLSVDRSEEYSLGCNVLSLGERRLLALEENRITNQLLADFGFEVITFPGSELCLNGGGGPTCLTRPFLRHT